MFCNAFNYEPVNFKRKLFEKSSRKFQHNFQGFYILPVIDLRFDFF